MAPVRKAFVKGIPKRNKIVMHVFWELWLRYLFALKEFVQELSVMEVKGIGNESENYRQWK